MDSDLLTRYGGSGKSVLQLTASVTDTLAEGQPDVTILWARAYAEIGERLISEFGEADDGEFDVDDGLTWVFPRVAIVLRAARSGIDIEIVNPRYRSMPEYWQEEL
jgi:hypothetical protein